jgi:hypothetical protein
VIVAGEASVKSRIACQLIAIEQPIDGIEHGTVLDGIDSRPYCRVHAAIVLSDRPTEKMGIHPMLDNTCETSTSLALSGLFRVCSCFS